MKGLHKFVKLFRLLQHLDLDLLSGSSEPFTPLVEIGTGLHFYYLSLDARKFVVLYENVMFSKKASASRPSPFLARQRAISSPRYARGIVTEMYLTGFEMLSIYASMCHPISLTQTKSAKGGG